MDNKHYDLSDYQIDKLAVGSRAEPVVMCTDDTLFIDMPHLPDRNELCEIVFKDGSRGEGRLSIARGWFKSDGQPFTNKSPIKKWYTNV